MRATTKLLQIVIWVVLTVAGFHVLAAKEPLYDGLGSYSRKITTNSAEAQRYFDQGLGFLHGFNHRAAIRAFQQAAELDPECAMAHWGVALACGPHINSIAVPPPAAELAWKELELAQKNAGNASPVERALIGALAKRYANPQPEDRSGLDRAYADAMREVWKKYPKDPDVGALFAEAMMNLRPWDQWTPDGKPQPGTDEIIATLDAVLKLNPNHPLANHLYIHAVEASPNPERAMAAADRLRNLQPGLAHNVHMPSHIDIRTGQWLKAVDTNAKAVEADQRYRKIFGPPKGFLNVYIAHNRHMLAYAAMMTGQRDLAMKHIRAMVAEMPPDFLKENALQAEGNVAMPLGSDGALWPVGRNPGRAGKIYRQDVVHPRISSCRPRDRVRRERRHGQRAQSAKCFCRTRQARAKGRFCEQQQLRSASRRRHSDGRGRNSDRRRKD